MNDKIELTKEQACKLFNEYLSTIIDDSEDLKDCYPDFSKSVIMSGFKYKTNIIEIKSFNDNIFYVDFFLMENGVLLKDLNTILSDNHYYDIETHNCVDNIVNFVRGYTEKIEDNICNICNKPVSDLLTFNRYTVKMCSDCLNEFRNGKCCEFQYWIEKKIKKNYDSI